MLEAEKSAIEQSLSSQFCVCVPWKCTLRVIEPVCAQVSRCMFVCTGYLRCSTGVSDRGRIAKLEGGRHWPLPPTHTHKHTRVVRYKPACLIVFTSVHMGTDTCWISEKFVTLVCVCVCLNPPFPGCWKEGENFLAVTLAMRLSSWAFWAAPTAASALPCAWVVLKHKVS